MNKLAIAFIGILLIPNAAWAQNKTRDGAVVGGLTGAVVGGIIGKQNKETTEGVLIGGAVGAVAGGVIGHSKDKQIARERQYQHEIAMQQQQIQAQQQALMQAQRGTASVNDVIQMSRSGIGDQIIMNHVMREGVDRPLEVADIIYLHQQGVSEAVISAMQRATTSRVPVMSRPPAQYPYGNSTVIVRESYPTYSPQPPVYRYSPPSYRSYPAHYYRPF